AHSVPYLVEVSLQVGFELLDCLPVHAGRTLVGFDRFVRFVHSPFLDRERLVCRIRRRHPVSSCFAEHDHLTRPLCSSPITGPSTLLRVDPSQSPASVLSPRGFRRLCFSLAIRGWFLQFRAKAYVRLTPPLRRSPSAQSSGPRRTCPRRDTRPWFCRRLLLNDASSTGSLSFVFRTLTCSRSCPERLVQRSPPHLLDAAAWSGLRPA